MDVIDAWGVILRHAARVLLLDAAGRVLLLRWADPHRPDEPFWISPGGGIEGGERPVDCAVRELNEETGIRLEPRALSGPVGSETVEFTFEGARYRQEQTFFTARVPGGPVAPTRLEAVEERSLLGHRWWSLAELDGAAERYYPRNLPAMLRTLGVAG